MYHIDGLNLIATLLISPAEAELGGLKKIPVPGGNKITVSVKAKTVEGDEIVVTGAGLSDKNKTGDIIFRIKIDNLDYLDESTIRDDLLKHERILN
jgi:DnaJ-class molecular chaperone